MATRFQKLREEGSKGKKANPLILEEFQWDNEWVDVNAEGVHQSAVGDELLTWAQVDEAAGASQGLRGRNVPRRARGDGASESSERPVITYSRSRLSREGVDEVEDNIIDTTLEDEDEDNMGSSDDDDNDGPSGGGSRKEAEFELDEDLVV